VIPVLELRQRRMHRACPCERAAQPAYKQHALAHRIVHRPPLTTVVSPHNATRRTARTTRKSTTFKHATRTSQSARGSYLALPRTTCHSTVHCRAPSTLSAAKARTHTHTPHNRPAALHPALRSRTVAPPAPSAAPPRGRHTRVRVPPSTRYPSCRVTSTRHASATWAWQTLHLSGPWRCCPGTMWALGRGPRGTFAAGARSGP